MRKNIHLIIWLLCGLLGLVTFVRFYEYTNTEASVDLSVGREQAVKMADDFIRLALFEPSGYEKHVTFHGCDTVYLQDVAGIKRTNDLIQSEVPCWQWSVRYFKELKKDGFYVGVDPANGKIVYFYHSLLEDARGERLTQEKARTIAEGYFNSLGEDIKEYILLKNTTTKKKNRTDHNFTWNKKGFEIGEAELHVAMSIDGDQLGYYSKYLDTPEQFNRDFVKTETPGMVLSFISMIGMFLLGIAAIFSLIVQYKHHRVRWRLAWGIGLIFIPLNILSFYNELPFVWTNYMDTVSKNFFLTMSLVTMLVGTLVSVLLIVLFCAAGEAVASRIRQNSFPIIDGLRENRLDRKGLLSRITIGYCLGFGGLGYVTVFYLIVMNYFHVWKPISPDYSDILASRMPFLYPLTIAFFAAITEEFMSRLFAISFLKKYTRSLGLAIVIPAIIWALGHSSYQIFPMYVRGIELTIIGIIWGLVYWRYGIETVIIAHYSYNAVMVGIPLLRSNNPYFIVSGIGVIILLTIPGLICPFWLKKKKSLVSQPDSDQGLVLTANPEGVPATTSAQTFDSITIIPLIFILSFVVPYLMGNKIDQNTERIKDFKTHYENGQVESEGVYKGGRPEGKRVWYYETGEVQSEQTYKNGKREGPFKTFHKNGHLKEEGKYVNGEIADLHKEYYQNGQLKSVGPYENGQWHGKWTWYSEIGTLSAEIVYQHGKKEFEYKGYYENGVLREEGKYVADKREEVWKSYHENGRLMSEGLYLHDQQHGPWRWYYESGNLKAKAGFDHGKTISRIIKYEDKPPQ